MNQENLPFFSSLELTHEKKGISSRPKAVKMGVNLQWFCPRVVMSAWPMNPENFQINIWVTQDLDKIVLSVMGLTCSFFFPSLPLSFLIPTALANKITWWIFLDNMGSGTSTTEDEGHLDDTHEESKSLFFLPTCDVLLSILWNLALHLISGNLCEGHGDSLKALLKTECTTFPHCELMTSDLFSHK